MSSLRFSACAVIVLFVSILAWADPAPKFVLRGRVVYLDFWASWCAPCRKSFPWMDELQKKYGDLGLTVIGVNLDRERDKAYTFLSKLKPGFKIAFNPDGSVAEKYQVKGMPSSYLIDRQGNIVYTHLGFEEKEAKVIEDQIKELLSK
jgi:cytochrome c biogenesis protein CcmG/thiol:disulfide interchange protein DsbE